MSKNQVAMFAILGFASQQRGGKFSLVDVRSSLLTTKSGLARYRTFAIWNLINQGKLTRIGRGQYKLAT